MTGILATLVLVVASVFLANIPFVSGRALGVVKVPRKSLAFRLAELAVGYLIVGAFAFALEGHLHGAAYPQGWEFYVVTAALFVVFAFPGFIYCYLWRKH